MRTDGILSATQRHKDCYKTQRGKLIGDCRSELNYGKQRLFYDFKEWLK